MMFTHTTAKFIASALAKQTVTASRSFRGPALGLAACLALGLLGIGSAHGQVLTGWDFSDLPGGLNDFGPSPYAPDTVAANLSVGGLTRGSGLTTSGTGAARAFGANGWTGANAADAITNNDFITFNLQATAGNTLSINSINPFEYRRSGTGPASGQLQYQVGAGMFTDVGGILSYTNITSAGDVLPPIDLSTVAALQNVAAADTVTFRIVNYGATSTGGTWYLFDGPGFPATGDATNDFVVNGTVNAVVAGNNFYLDLNGATPGSGVTAGSTTNFSSGSWSADAAGAAATGAFTNGQTPTFSAGTDAAGAYTVNVDMAVNANGLSFEEGNVTLAAGAGSLTLTGATVNVAAAASAVIAEPILGAVGLNKTGTGSLSLTGANAFTGTTTLTAGTLDIGAGGSLSQAGGTATVTVASANVTLTNAGTISQTGTGRAIDANTAGTVLNLTNAGTITSVGGNETIRLAATSALNLTNQVGASITSNAADAIRPGNGSMINNFGTISANPPDVAAPAGSDGIDLRTERTGITVNNSGTISGRHGIATDGANAGPSSLTVNNLAGGMITALNGSGLNVDGVSASVTANVTNAAGATIKGGLLANSTNGDGDGIDIDGVLTLDNSGDILGNGAKGVGSDTLPNNAEAIAVGGGSIINRATGRIIGNSVAPNADVSRAGNGILVDNSSAGNAIAPMTVTNSGLIQGATGFGIKLIGTQNDAVTNSGTIIGGNGSAVDLGGGDDTMNITGSAASVTGSMDGGAGANTLNLAPDAGSSFSYAGAISNFAAVNVQSGTTTLSGVSPYSGPTVVSNSTLIVDGSIANSAVSTTGAGMIKGNGTLGSITINSGGTLAPGSSPGILTATGNVLFGAGSTFEVELNGTTAGPGVNGYDQLVLSGAASNLDLNDPANNLAVILGFAPAAGDLFTVASLAGSGSILGMFETVNGAPVAGNMFNVGGASFQINYAGGSGNDLVVQALGVVPEPSRALLLLAGFGLLAGRRRRA